MWGWWRTPLCGTPLCCAAVVLVWLPVFEAVVAREPCIFHGVISTGIKFDEVYIVVCRVLVAVNKALTGGPQWACLL